MYGQDTAGGKWTLRADYRPGGTKKLLAATPFTCRVAREGIHRMYETADGSWIAIGKGMILYRYAGDARFQVATTDFYGSRPLYLGNNPESGNWFFGEYFSNPTRQLPVRIFQSRDGKEWRVAHTFRSGVIRHIHNIVWDPYRKGLWVLTGDRDKECGLWFTQDDFQTLERVHGGSQSYRAVSLLMTSDELLVPSDTPLEPNAIRRIDRKSGVMNEVARLSSSAFHTFSLPEGMLVTTVGEPSSVNDNDHAYLYFSPDGKEWSEVGCHRRDTWSMLSRFLFRYPEIIPVGTTEDGVLRLCRHCPPGVRLRASSLKNQLIKFYFTEHYVYGNRSVFSYVCAYKRLEIATKSRCNYLTI